MVEVIRVADVSIHVRIDSNFFFHFSSLPLPFTHSVKLTGGPYAFSCCTRVSCFVCLVVDAAFWLEYFAFHRGNPLISIECNKVVDNRFISVLLRYIFLYLVFASSIGIFDRHTFRRAPCCRFRAVSADISHLECNRKDHFSSVYLMHSCIGCALHCVFARIVSSIHWRNWNMNNVKIDSIVSVRISNVYISQ